MTCELLQLVTCEVLNVLACEALHAVSFEVLQIIECEVTQTVACEVLQNNDVRSVARTKKERKNLAIILSRYCRHENDRRSLHWFIVDNFSYASLSVDRK